MPKYKVNIDLDNNELKNVRIDNVATNPALAYPGKIIYNTTLQTLLYYDGTNWINIYDNIFNSDGTLTSNRKMIMHGNTLSEHFSIRNNLDDTDLFKVDGVGNVDFVGVDVGIRQCLSNQCTRTPNERFTCFIFS